MTRTAPNPSTISAHASHRETSPAAPLGAATAVHRACAGGVRAVLAALIVAHGCASRYAFCLMRRSYAIYMLPGQGKTPPHKSATKLSARDAAAVGALYPIPGTTEYRDEPDDDQNVGQQPPAKPPGQHLKAQ